LRQTCRGAHVLLVEDNPINQQVARALLEHAGVTAETAEDGQRAIELATSRPYDLILMDMQMPVMDGLEATREIRQRLGRSIPIIAMTANAFGDDREACLQAGMNDHVAKPVNPEQLYATLLRWLHLANDEPGPISGSAAAIPKYKPESILATKLTHIPGFDAELALHNVGPALLEQILQTFVDTYRHGEPRLLRIGVAGTPAEWSATCHSLRGACVSVGAVGLEQQLRVLDTLVRESSDAAALIADAQHVHAALLTLVRQLSEAFWQ
jgi:two-component system, sensor histidine kinase and response regulator